MDVILCMRPLLLKDRQFDQKVAKICIHIKLKMIRQPNLVPRAFSSTIFKMADRREKTLAKAGITWYKISKNLGDFYHVTF